MSADRGDQPSGAFEIHSSVGSGLRAAVVLTTAFTVFAAFLAVGCFLGLLTQDLPGPQAFSALVIGGLGVMGTVGGTRAVRGLRAVSGSEVVARLDGDGMHLHEGAGVPDLPEHLAWRTVPWAWVSSVSHTTLDLGASKRLGADVPLDVLRFALADDQLSDGDLDDHPALRQAARLFGLTPTQARNVLVGEVGSTDFAAAAAWIHRYRPDVPVLSGTTLPWSTKAAPDTPVDGPRVAVVGAHGRLGRQVLEVLTRRERAAPVAVVRNEAHRPRMERMGAEVRMVDLRQGPEAVADALRGCAAVVQAADTGTEVVVEAARRAGVERLLLVTSTWRGDDEVTGASRSGLAWTAFRTSALTDSPATGEVDLGPDVSPGPVPRADLAEVLVAAIRDEDSVGGVWPIAGTSPAAS